MKIRESFVSNSSTTSYVVIVSKKNYDNVLKESDEVTRFLAEQVVDERKKLFGKTVVTLVYSTGNYNSFENVDVMKFLSEEDKRRYEEEDDFDIIYQNREEKFFDFINKLSKDKENFIEVSNEF